MVLVTSSDSGFLQELQQEKCLPLTPLVMPIGQLPFHELQLQVLPVVHKTMLQSLEHDEMVFMFPNSMMMVYMSVLELRVHLQNLLFLVQLLLQEI